MHSPRGSTGTFRLFVYGTLKRGGSRHGPLAQQRFLGMAESAPGYALFNLGDYPGLIHDEHSANRVQGELYEVACSLVDWLDAVEGSPDWFKLEPIALAGHDELVWAYFYQSDPGDRPRILEGRWEVPG
ncbi:MAG: gamma-glutamylcyclotransferase family protein [Gemmataceae bacterium]